MKIRFWQKTYLLTLLLFLLCLYAGIFSLAAYTHSRTVQDASRTAQAEQSYIALSFERDLASLQEAGNGNNPSLLMLSYISHYEKQGIFLSFRAGEEVVGATAPVPFPDTEAEVIATRRLDGTRYVCIRSTVGGSWELYYLKNVGELDEKFRSLMLIYTLVAAGISVFLATALLLILKRLSVPLEQLRGIAERITAGDLETEADESGKDEFSELAKSFNSMVCRLKEQMQKLSEDAFRKQMLVDNMAHELRTPLTSIRGYAEYLERGAITEEDRIESVGWIRSEAIRLQSISEKILDMAYIRENGIESQPVSLLPLLEQTRERLLSKAQACAVALEIDRESQPVTLPGDATLLSMLIDNLTDNAVKACAEGGHVWLSCTREALCVRDDGKGMTPEQLAHIAEPFYRTDKSRSRAEGGAGLGLALCERIAQAHGMALRFASEPGVGTKVFLLFRNFAET